MPRSNSAWNELIDVIGEDGVFLLANRFGGTRLLIPMNMGPTHEITDALGAVKSQALRARFAPDVIKVPLARELRAVRYRDMGMSNAKIAVQLGLTESGVEKLFKRVRCEAVDTTPQRSAEAGRHG